MDYVYCRQKFHCVIYYNFRHTFVPYDQHKGTQTMEREKQLTSSTVCDCGNALALFIEIHISLKLTSSKLSSNVRVKLLVITPGDWRPRVNLLRAIQLLQYDFRRFTIRSNQTLLITVACHVTLTSPDQIDGMKLEI